MSDETPQKLTPAEQRVQDQAQVKIQMAQTDIVEAFRKGVPFAGPPAGRTSFEGFELNSMIDLVENTRPEDLESAGKALWAARDAISKAAEELDTYLTGVDWQGESGTAFRAFGKGLVAHARELGDFAEVAGTQITVAGTGLASVRSAMPPRDDRQVRKSPDDIELPARTADNPEYQAALKVEKNRQEAINQINRLASYYAVSGKRLEGQEPPRFEKLLPIDMPPPVGGVGLPGGSGGSSPDGFVAGGGTGQSYSVRSVAEGPEAPSTFGGRAAVDPLGPAPTLDGSTATEINSVAPPQTPPTVTSAPPSPAPTPSTGPTGVLPPMLPGPTNPGPRGTQRPTGPTGMSRTVGQTGPGWGKAQPTGGGPVARGQGGLPAGRPGPMSGGGGSSFAGRPVGGPQSPIAGRPGVTGGRPVVGQGGTPAVGGPRAGGRNGIVGGTAQQPPRSRGAAGGVGQRGVIGGPGAAAASRAGGRTTPAPGGSGVVGAARKAAGGGPNTKGFTTGGAGLVRGPADRRQGGREDEDNGSTRPDYLTEDEETWNAVRRGAVPPVVE
ncbi:hypothetical protein [Streptomyces sp. V2I9]|uniref:hypothetical protein n=1 Tax=Streptomyces sp. V2I9 TaxID=3042304 RepID=UPI002789FAF8|nr:hypothetical protein [Streptomyces sp. V2I9]MDQ0987431.1 hypothetical protein [Streptomyces sp. V2I9]